MKVGAVTGRGCVSSTSREVFTQGDSPDPELAGNFRFGHTISYPPRAWATWASLSTFARPLDIPRAFARTMPLGLALLNYGAFKLSHTPHKPQHQLGDRVRLRRMRLPLAQESDRAPATHEVFDNRP